MIERTLGVKWKIKDDKLNFTTNMKEYNTKHGIFSGVKSFLDTLAFLKSFMLNGKQLIPEMWMEKADWEAGVSIEMLKIWKK